MSESEKPPRPLPTQTIQLDKLNADEIFIEDSKPQLDAPIHAVPPPLPPEVRALATSSAPPPGATPSAAPPASARPSAAPPRSNAKTIALVALFVVLAIGAIVGGLSVGGLVRGGGAASASASAAVSSAGAIGARAAAASASASAAPVQTITIPTIEMR